MSGGDWKELFKAGCDGDLALVEFHVRRGVDLNYAHPEFLSTPLVAAILARQEATALFMLEHGARPDLHSEFDGMAPLQAARQAGLARVEARLLALGALPPPAPAAPPERPRRGLRAWCARWLPQRRPQRWRRRR